MLKFTIAPKQNKKSNFIVWLAQADVKVILNGAEVTTQSTRTVRLYTLLEGKDGDVLEVKESQMEQMIGDKGPIDGFFWLKG
jgi:hypothetical protein